MKLSEEMKVDGAGIHDQQGFLNILGYIPKVEKLESENEKMKKFIQNGVEFGYIRLPDKETDDTALRTYNEINYIKDNEVKE
jgi:hypothetical protein